MAPGSHGDQADPAEIHAGTIPAEARSQTGPADIRSGSEIRGRGGSCGAAGETACDPGLVDSPRLETSSASRHDRCGRSVRADSLWPRFPRPGRQSSITKTTAVVDYVPLSVPRRVDMQPVRG